MMKRGAPHRAQAADHDVETRHGAWPPKSCILLLLINAGKPKRARGGDPCKIPAMKLLPMLILVAALGGVAFAQTVPMPRPRPAEGAASQPHADVAAAEPSACRLRLTG